MKRFVMLPRRNAVPECKKVQGIATPAYTHGLVFFFQAEDGIRDDLVTGVQTCALPILRFGADGPGAEAGGVGGEIHGNFCAVIFFAAAKAVVGAHAFVAAPAAEAADAGRSEERRVGKECRSRWSPYH